MKKVNWLLGAALLLACCSVASAKDGTIATVLDKNLGNVEKEFVSAAEAMPEEKYTFAPTEGEFKGVRSFAAQVKHVAAVNYVIAAAVLGEKPPVDTGEEAGPASMTSKADIVKFLKDSFAYLHKANASINEKNQLDVVELFGMKFARSSVGTFSTAHPFDHYGQMVEYLRMNGIVPPASRPQPKK